MADTANHISELDNTLPTSGGPAGEGDDEIRTVKRVLTNDFAGINAAVYEDADTSGAGGSTPVSSTTMSSWEARIAQAEADIDTLQADPVIQVGMIMLWSGTVGTIPTGWTLCDGVEANGQTPPDLRSRFVLGAGGLSDPGETGGDANPTTSSNGAHTHPVTVNNHVLTAAQLPDIGNNLRVEMDASSQSDSHTQVGTVARGRDANGTFQTEPMSTTGLNGQGHSHNASSDSDGAHTHTVNVVPPYYALAYIMYVGTP